MSIDYNIIMACCMRKRFPTLQFVAYKQSAKKRQFIQSWGKFKLSIRLRLVDVPNFTELGHCAIQETSADLVVCFGGGAVVLDEFQRYGSVAQWYVFKISRLNREGNVEACKLNGTVADNLTFHGQKRGFKRERPKALQKEAQPRTKPVRRNNGKPSRQKPSDDPNFVKIEFGDKLGEFTVGNFIASGTFGRVYELSNSNGERYAGKIMPSEAQYIQYDSSAVREAKVLEAIANHPNALGLHSYFPLQRNSEFYCLVLEYMGCSVYDIIQANQQNGMDIFHIQSITKQLLSLLGFLNDIGQTHTDIKHKNTCLVDSTCHVLRDQNTWPSQTQRQNTTLRQYYSPVSVHIKLIDYGNATGRNDPHPTPIHTKQFRCPEVLLQSSVWDEKSDLWCIGITLLYMYTGRLHTNSHNPQELLGMMEVLLGSPIPKSMLQQARAKRMRPRGSQLGTRWSKSKKISRAVPLKSLINPEHEDFSRFIKDILTFDPKKRPTAKELSSNLNI